MISLRNCRIGVIGLCYVRLPLAAESGQRFDTVRIDVNAQRIRVCPISRQRKRPCDVAVLAVGHREFKEPGVKAIHGLCRKQHMVYDIKYLFAADQVDGRL